MSGYPVLSGTSGIFVDISACPPASSANLHITASWDCRQVGALSWDALEEPDVVILPPSVTILSPSCHRPAAAGRLGVALVTLVAGAINANHSCTREPHELCMQHILGFL